MKPAAYILPLILTSVKARFLIITSVLLPTEPINAALSTPVTVRFFILYPLPLSSNVIFAPSDNGDQFIPVISISFASINLPEVVVLILLKSLAVLIIV